MRETDVQRKLGLGLVLLLIPALWCTDASAQRDGNRIPLTSIGVVSSLNLPNDPDDPGIGGGFDHVSYFRNRFSPQLEDCSKQLETVFRDWAQQHNLSIPFRDGTPGNVRLHATKSGLGGLFEMTYRVDIKRERARVTVFFFSQDGARQEPVAIESLLVEWQIADLQDGLDRALVCGTA